MCAPSPSRETLIVHADSDARLAMRHCLNERSLGCREAATAHKALARPRQAGRVLTRRQPIQSLWGSRSPSSERAIDAHIKSIRRKLGEGRRCIQTVLGVGYRFCDER